MIVKKLRLLSFIIIPICIFAFGQAKVNAAATGDHVYSPIAMEEDKRSGNFCSDPSHPDDPRCQLFSFAFRGAGAPAAATDAGVKNVNLTTDERDKHVKDKTLEKLIIERADAVFANHESGAKVGTFKVISVSDIDVLKYLTPPEGEVEMTIKLGISDNNSKLATAFIETNLILKSTEEEKKKDKEDGKKDKGDFPVDIEDDSGGGSDDPGEDPVDDEEAAAKKKEEERKAKERARKAMLDKATATINAKEREKEENAAVSALEEREKSDGPSPLGVGLLALAMALAVFFGWWIRQDLKVINWFKQKKNLRSKM